VGARGDGWNSGSQAFIRIVKIICSSTFRVRVIDYVFVLFGRLGATVELLCCMFLMIFLTTIHSNIHTLQ
jgi:hypothetical protein